MTNWIKNMSKIISSNHIRETIDIADLSIVRRMGRGLDGEYTIYIGKVSNGAELNQSEIKELLPYLNRFADSGSLFEKVDDFVNEKRLFNLYLPFWLNNPDKYLNKFVSIAGNNIYGFCNSLEEATEEGRKLEGKINKSMFCCQISEKMKSQIDK